MKTEASKYVAVAVKTTSSSSQLKTRKSLHPLQPAATDKENLVGAGRSPRKLRSSLAGKTDTKHEMITKKPIVIKNDPVKKIIAKAKVDSNRRALRDTKKSPNQKDDVTLSEVPAKKTTKETKKTVKDNGNQTENPAVRDMTEEEPSPGYWKALAEKRRIALEEALEENRTLSDQVRIYKEMLDESRQLVDVLQEMIAEGEASS